MTNTEIKSCYIGPEISPEQFIPEHFFIYLSSGKIDGYDGDKHFSLHPGHACIARKNHLARYTKTKQDDTFEKTVVVFDESFLKKYQARHKITRQNPVASRAFLPVAGGKQLDEYIRSLQYFQGGGINVINKEADHKREELLLLLLRSHPGYINIFFDFGKPGRLDLQAFMNKHYKFNVSIERFAFLTGRSLSAFKRDFNEIFQQTPSRWLIQRRLQEAYFLITKKKFRPKEFYLDVGFEDLSHFSFAFKKQFGLSPTDLASDRNR
ncbi:MAG: helix-turn-helix transcriptional regulator [Chitinophagaceae bacterium]|nr:helix-turn-helix transcriptional regulator [Chitinophagaceae bacterium]MCW5928613.1 helix-turn-helix transcriptional regulator [Chitinophagaceae bacterium]